MSKSIFVITDKCTGCGACISACPQKALEMTHDNGKNKNLKKVILNKNRCNYCKNCLEFCRYDALIDEI